ncbi:hypothetical protein ACFX2I_036166 [Malus domestica]
MFLTRIFCKHVPQAHLSKTIMESGNTLRNSTRTDAKHLKSLYSLYSGLEQLNGQHGYAYVSEPEHLKGMVFHLPRNIADRHAAEEDAARRRCPQGPPSLQNEYQPAEDKDLFMSPKELREKKIREGKWKDWPWYGRFVVVSKWIKPVKFSNIDTLAKKYGLEVVPVAEIKVKK